MKICNDPAFLQLPEEVGRLFSDASRSSFFNTPGWYDLVARLGTPADWKPRLIADDAAQACFVLQAPAAGGELASCVNPYSCDHAILAGDNHAHVVRALAAVIGQHAPRLSRIRLTGLDPAEGSFAAACGGFRDARFAVRPFFAWGNRHENVDGKSFEQYLAARPSVLVSTWKRKLSALQKKAAGAFSIHRRGENLESFISAYEHVHANSWKVEEPFPRFVPALVRHAASVGALRMGILTVNGEAAAAQFWIVWQRKATLFKLSYVDRFREFSPGTLLTMHLIRHILVNDAPAEISFGRGDDAYKSLWVSSRRECWGIDAANLRTPRGLLLAAQMTAGRARHALVRRLAAPER
jgi:Acetyltransferase (GNAT) domain